MVDASKRNVIGRWQPGEGGLYLVVTKEEWARILREEWETPPVPTEAMFLGYVIESEGWNG